MKFNLSLWMLLGAPLLFTSCFSLKTSGIAYQSVTTEHAQPDKQSPIPDEAQIAVAYTISSKGELTAVVFNRTSNIMLIDQTMSFFVNSDGTSTSYYDPTVRTTSVTNLSASTKGISVNAGAITSALGIGGTVGRLASGINLGGSGTSGQSATSTTYIADMPQVSLAPKSNGAMSKVFNIKGIGFKELAKDGIQAVSLNKEDSYCRFSVCISYSIDNGKTFEKIVTDFYADSRIVIPVKKNGMLNDALREIYISKPDALSEPWWMLSPINSRNESNSCVMGVLYDYK